MNITEWIWDRIDADPQLPEDAKYLVVAAIDGPDSFDAAITGTAIVRSPAPAATVPPPEPAKAFLSKIVVEGFRGIGNQSTLSLSASPGLVVVAGRNGSGKSSFAEAIDVALRNRSDRAGKHPSLGPDQWRNLHHRLRTAIRVELVVEGRGQTTVGVDWEADADYDQRRTWTQTVSEKRVKGMDGLGWKESLELYPPMLSYDELGGVFDGRPSELYDALEAFLGLRRITDAMSILSAQLKKVSTPAKVLGAACLPQSGPRYRAW